MINTERIVPVQATDLITLYSRIFAVANVTVTPVSAGNAEGDFTVSAAATALLCNEPAKSIDIAAAVTSATIYFVPAYDYKGFTLAGTATVTAGDTVTADHGELYKAVLSGGTVTISKVGA